MQRLAAVLFLFSSYPSIERLHPLQGGIFRRKYRLDRRPGLPIEPIWSFYPLCWWEIAAKHVRMARRWIMIERMRREILRDPHHRGYTDRALTPVSDDETGSLELLTQSDGARREVDRARKMATLSGRAKAPA